MGSSDAWGTAFYRAIRGETSVSDPIYSAHRVTRSSRLRITLSPKTKAPSASIANATTSPTIKPRKKLTSTKVMKRHLDGSSDDAEDAMRCWAAQYLQLTERPNNNSRIPSSEKRFPQCWHVGTAPRYVVRSIYLAPQRSGHWRRHFSRINPS